MHILHAQLIAESGNPREIFMGFCEYLGIIVHDLRNVPDNESEDEEYTTTTQERESDPFKSLLAARLFVPMATGIWFD